MTDEWNNVGWFDFLHCFTQMKIWYSNSDFNSDEFEICNAQLLIINFNFSFYICKILMQNLYIVRCYFFLLNIW